LRSERKIIVVIPAYNEAENIAEVVTRATRHAPVLVVNDGSTDRTGEIAAALPNTAVINHERNTHIPGAILDGFRYALANGYDYAVTMDAGLSHDPGLLPALIAQPDADLIRRLVARGDLDVLVAGGITDVAGVRRLADLGASGVILGHALLSGAIDLPSALEAAA